MADPSPYAALLATSRYAVYNMNDIYVPHVEEIEPEKLAPVSQTYNLPCESFGTTGRSKTVSRVARHCPSLVTRRPSDSRRSDAPGLVRRVVAGTHRRPGVSHDPRGDSPRGPWGADSDSAPRQATLVRGERRRNDGDGSNLPLPGEEYMRRYGNRAGSNPASSRNGTRFTKANVPPFPSKPIVDMKYRKNFGGQVGKNSNVPVRTAPVKQVSLRFRRNNTLTRHHPYYATSVDAPRNATDDELRSAQDGRAHAKTRNVDPIFSTAGYCSMQEMPKDQIDSHSLRTLQTPGQNRCYNGNVPAVRRGRYYQSSFRPNHHPNDPSTSPVQKAAHPWRADHEGSEEDLYRFSHKNRRVSPTRYAQQQPVSQDQYTRTPTPVVHRSSSRVSPESSHTKYLLSSVSTIFRSETQ